ncbi:MAG: glycosyltransferase [Ignavibacteriae bacterium]|nr:MAG: glycosyltransferase [Ignavibacteriota bacterium]
MHVLFATNQATALTRGGVRTQVLQTKEALEHLGVHVTLFDTWRDFHPADFDLVHLFAANMATYHFARAMKAQGLPLVISPVFFTRRQAGLVRKVIKTDRLISRTMRGIWTDYGLIAEMCSWARAVTPNTTEEGKLFIEAFEVPEKKLFVIPNGVEKRFSHAASGLFEREYGIKDFILSVGNIGPERKNMHRLIEALEGIDHPAAIIGRIEDTPSGRACLERARHNPRLLIIDAIAHDSMLLASAYAACDVFALPSQFETPGIAALEAGLAGAKIVITPIGGTKEYFGDQAVYVEPASVKNITEGIRTALKTAKDNVLRSRILKEFLWENVGEKTKQVYESVLSSA